MAKVNAPTTVKKSKNPITGIINVTGEPDSGKSLFALSSGAVPERTAFIDDDVKGNAIVRMIEAEGRSFGLYHNLIRETDGMRELELHKHCMSILETIEEGQFDVLVWDTWTRMENTFFPVVHANPTRFKQFYSPMGQIKGAEEWGASFAFEAAILAKMSELVPLVILTSHLKKDGQKRDVAESKKALVQKSRMRVWLRHNSESPEPIGLMLKRLSKIDFEKGMKPINVTHRKMVPFTWERLLYYWDNPVGNTTPPAGEQLNEFELSILDGILTRDQKDALRLAVIEAERERLAEEKNQRDINRLMQRGVPLTGIDIITKAFEDYEMEMDTVVRLSGMDEDELMSLEGSEVNIVWAKIQDAADEEGVANIIKKETARVKAEGSNGKSPAKVTKPAKSKR